MSATYPKDGTCTKMAQAPGSKTIKCAILANGQAADIGPAPTSRVYTSDYSKVKEQGDSDIVSEFLGNPMRW